MDRYRQFAEVDPDEITRELRERRARERALALAEVPTLDLSRTEWPEFPWSASINAAIYVARGRMNAYADPRAAGVRELLADHHGVLPSQVVVGNGAAELLQAAAHALLGPDDELLVPWPSYPLYPLMARRAGGRPVAVPLTAEGEVDVGPLLDHVGPRTRAVALANPNDPTGAWLRSEGVRELALRLPEHVHLLLDEALVHFQDSEPLDAGLRLVDELPRLVVFRSFSKAYALAGLRGGYAVGAAEGSGVLDALAPALGVNAFTQAAIAHALSEAGARHLERRRTTVIAKRERLFAGLGDLAVEAP